MSGRRVVPAGGVGAQAGDDGVGDSLHVHVVLAPVDPPAQVGETRIKTSVAWLPVHVLHFGVSAVGLHGGRVSLDA